MEIVDDANPADKRANRKDDPEEGPFISEELSVAEWLLSRQELSTLVRNTIRGAGDKGITYDDLERVVAWARQAKAESLLLRLVLDGEVNICVRHGEITFAAIENDSPAGASAAGA
jgi:hypothetical protein